MAGERSLRAAVERFAVVRADRLILTKLDEADGLGGVLAVLGQADRPVSYLTTGQAVPDDIEPADRTRLARLILGHEGGGSMTRHRSSHEAVDLSPDNADASHGRASEGADPMTREWTELPARRRRCVIAQDCLAREWRRWPSPVQVPTIDQDRRLRRGKRIDDLSRSGTRTYYADD